MQQPQADKLLDAFQSPAYPIFGHQQRILDAYSKLTNCTTRAVAVEALKELRLAATDCEKAIRSALVEYGCADALVLNINKEAKRLWRGDAMSMLFTNARHELAKLIHMPDTKAKKKALTALYFLTRDIVECAEAMKPENYCRKEPTE